MADRINKAELARRLDVSPPYISKLIRLKKLKFDDDGLIDYDEAVKQIKNSSERITNSIDTDGDEPQQEDYKYWKTESEKWKSKKEELDYQEKLKNLIPREKVEQDAFLIANLVKEQFLSMPESLCNIFAAESDPMVIREMWIKETKRVLTELADKLEDMNK
jgi:hypothetical protein